MPKMKAANDNERTVIPLQTRATAFDLRDPEISISLVQAEIAEEFPGCRWDGDKLYILKGERPMFPILWILDGRVVLDPRYLSETHRLANLIIDL